MNPDQQSLCISITTQLSSHPTAYFFNKPIDPKRSGMRDYFKKIRNPQDLGTILERLKLNEYSSVSQWETDVNTVWTNAITYHGEDSLMAIVARHMMKVFTKLKLTLEKHTVNGWTKVIYNYREKVDKLFLQAPNTLQTVLPKSLDVAVPLLPPFTSKEVTQFIQASQLVNSPQDIEAVTNIIRKSIPPIKTDEEELVIDVNNLDLPTMHALRNYYRKRLVELSIPYPS